MNDRYLFKAKQIDNGEWIIGSLIQTPFMGTIRSWISSEEADKTRLRSVATYKAEWRSIEVRTDTICQCTGLKDKNGTLIWENDVVRCIDHNSDLEFYAAVRFGNPNGLYSWAISLTTSKAMNRIWIFSYGWEWKKQEQLLK